MVRAVALDWPLARPQAGMRVLALLLVLAAIQNASAQHINFIEFSSNGRQFTCVFAATEPPSSAVRGPPTAGMSW